MIEFKPIIKTTIYKCENIVKSYPILLTFLLCVIFASLSFMREESIDPGNLFFLLGVLLCGSFALSLAISKRYSFNNVITVGLFILFGLLSVLYVVSIHTSTDRSAQVFYTGFALILAIAVYKALNKTLTVEYVIFSIFILGFLLRLTYVWVTPAWARQHDVYNFGDSGHSGYIKYFYENNFKLPDFDVRTVDQFYHPPLHHMIAAMWWKILSLFGIADGYAQESIQTLTLFYSSVCMILSLKIFKWFKLKGLPLILAFSIIAFHPTFIIFAGSINNDILSVTFMLAAFYFALKWYSSNSLKELLLCGLTLGLGMATKLSAYMMALPIAFIFLIRLIKDYKVDKNSAKAHILRFALFLLICAPLGLFYPLRNFILYNVPPTYVPNLGENSWQYLGNYTFFERVFKIEASEFASVYDQWLYRDYNLYHEYNPMIALLKTAMFGEYINDLQYPSIAFSGVVLFYTGLILAILSVAAMVYIFVVKIKRKESVIMEISLGILFVGMLLSYYVFCFAYPHNCTQNIRYASPLIIVGAIFIGLSIQELLQVKNQKAQLIVKYGAIGLISLFALFSTLVYLIIALS